MRRCRAACLALGLLLAAQAAAASRPRRSLRSAGLAADAIDAAGGALRKGADAASAALTNTREAAERLAATARATATDAQAALANATGAHLGGAVQRALAAPRRAAEALRAVLAPARDAVHALASAAGQQPAPAPAPAAPGVQVVGLDGRPVPGAASTTLRAVTIPAAAAAAATGGVVDVVPPGDPRYAALAASLPAAAGVSPGAGQPLTVMGTAPAAGGGGATPAPQPPPSASAARTNALTQAAPWRRPARGPAPAARGGRAADGMAPPPHDCLALGLAEVERTGRPERAQRQLLAHRLGALALSRGAALETSQAGGIRWMDLDGVEQRYLLTGAADSTIEAFDVLATQAADAADAGASRALRPLFTIARGQPAAHRYQVTSLCWYAVDTGLFVSGSADCEVKVWDTNALAVACAFGCPGKVQALGMSAVASAHALVAVGTKKPGVMLADVVSGAFVHTLDGHASGACAVCWSPSNQHHLLTGDAAGEVRLWDVRRSGCRALLSMHATQRAPRAAHGAAAAGAKRKAREPSYAQRQAGRARAAAAAPRARSRTRAPKGAFPKRLAATPDGRHAFSPRGDDVQVFDVQSGAEVALLSQGHYDAVTACAYSPRTGQLWSAGADGAVLAWEPWRGADAPDEEDGADARAQQEQAGPGPDWWMAAASSRRRAAAPPAAAAAAAAPRRTAPDIDAWSDDEG
ncbi:ATCSA-1 [Scenedesmus sp. PABB004]|nr:ATCSA-1 [Scenedesmus sp. PABB004]